MALTTTEQVSIDVEEKWVKNASVCFERDAKPNP